MNISAERVKQDLIKLEALSRELNGKVLVKGTSGNPVNLIHIVLDYPTAASKAYPSKVQRKTEVEIQLLSRYPFQEPKATITTPIFHPNVYRSGNICFGTKWLPTQGLDLLVRRIIQIITFDSTILNEASPANGDALAWYRSAVRNNPAAFPTDKLIVKEQAKSKISWNNMESTGDSKAVVSCTYCHSKLRVPANKTLNVSCPKCGNKFQVHP
ncbi:ubiquitin-conjugating enzyme E2 [Alteromonas macleodii]|uniref:ubiquitin-conjugating enzyme E2 n=1 Tax=Alteromonas macleodii TaxID=28108 RepID=UPI0036F48251